jgi:hypothetical protein
LREARISTSVANRCERAEFDRPRVQRSPATVLIRAPEHNSTRFRKAAADEEFIAVSANGDGYDFFPVDVARRISHKG